MGAVELAAVVAFFAFLEAFVWRLPRSLVKLNDNDIADLQQQYYTSVIPHRLNQSPKDMDWIKDLTQELNLPQAMQTAMSASERRGKWIMVIFLLSAVILAPDALGLGIMIGWFPLWVVPAVLLIFGLAWLIDYCTELSETRTSVVAMREKIRDLMVSSTLMQVSNRSTKRSSKQ